MGRTRCRADGRRHILQAKRFSRLRFLRHSGLGNGFETRSEMEGAATPWLTFDANRSAHHPDQPGTDGEAKSGAAVLARCGAVRLAERLEDDLLFIRRDADTRVVNREANGYVIVTRASENDQHAHLALGRKLDGIAKQVH